MTHRNKEWLLVFVGDHIDQYSDEEPAFWQPPAADEELVKDVWHAAEYGLFTRELRVFKAYYRDGYTGVEIAAQEGKSQRWVSGILKKCRADIRKYLERNE